MPKEESFPVPLKYIDVIRSTHTFRAHRFWHIDLTVDHPVGRYGRHQRRHGRLTRGLSVTTPWNLANWALGLGVGIPCSCRQRFRQKQLMICGSGRAHTVSACSVVWSCGRAGIFCIFCQNREGSGRCRRQFCGFFRSQRRERAPLLGNSPELCVSVGRWSISSPLLPSPSPPCSAIFNTDRADAVLRAGILM